MQFQCSMRKRWEPKKMSRQWQTEILQGWKAKEIKWQKKSVGKFEPGRFWRYDHCHHTWISVCQVFQAEIKQNDDCGPKWGFVFNICIRARRYRKWSDILLNETKHNCIIIHVIMSLDFDLGLKFCLFYYWTFCLLSVFVFLNLFIPVL